MGFFITFEGIDGCGKTVQASQLMAKLKSLSLPVHCFRDPGTTDISESIRNILLDKKNSVMSSWTELLLYEAARAQMVEESIKPALERGEIVLCDRFYDSTTAYQGYGRQLDIATVETVNKIGACGLNPDITFVVDVDIETALQRKNKEISVDEYDRLESEKRVFHERVRKGYFEIAKKEPKRVKIVQGNEPVEKVAESIWNYVAPLLEINV